MTVFPLSILVKIILLLVDLFLMAFIKSIFVLIGLKHCSFSFVILEVVNLRQILLVENLRINSVSIISLLKFYRYVSI